MAAQLQEMRASKLSLPYFLTKALAMQPGGQGQAAEDHYMGTMELPKAISESH